jgi:cob(I)alamin adenosyltransferase
VTAGQAERLERAIDAANERLQPLTSFVLPGGTPAAAWLHLARTVCRRAERAVVTLARAEPLNPHAVVYLNRLSDLLFVLARAANGDGAQDVLWVPGAGRGAG